MTRRRHALATVSVGLTLLLGLFAAGHVLGLRVNLTPSYPLGLWQIVPIEHEVGTGDIILICPPQSPSFELARDRGYVRFGLCPGSTSPLIKTVAAVHGQAIAVGNVVTIDGHLLPLSEVHSVDAEGRALSHYSGGVVPFGQVFLHSGFAGSYDSRYFGPIPLSGLLGSARPLLTIGR